MNMMKTGVIPPEGGALPGANLAEDLLEGAEEIAHFLFGDKKKRRKIYHLTETSRLPVFKMGAVLCARKSKLMAWIEAQESRAIGGGGN